MMITADLLLACGICKDGADFAQSYAVSANTSTVTFEQSRAVLLHYITTNPDQTSLKIEWYDTLPNNPIAVKFFNDYTRGNYGFHNISIDDNIEYITGEDQSIVMAEWTKPTDYSEYATLEEATAARLVNLDTYLLENTATTIFSILEEADTVGEDGVTPAVQLTPVDPAVFLQEQKESKYRIFNFETKEYEELNTFSLTKTRFEELRSQFLDRNCPIKQKVTNLDGDSAWDDLET